MKKLKQLILLCIFGCVPALWAGEAPIKEESTNPAPDDLYVVRLESIELDREWAEKRAGGMLELYADFRLGNTTWSTESVKNTCSVVLKNDNEVHLLNPRKESFTVDCMDDDVFVNDLLFTVIVRGEDVLAHKNRELVYSVDERGRAAIFSEDTDEYEVVGRVKFSVVALSGTETQFQIGRAFFNGGWHWKKDRSEAVKWFEKAAKQGHPRATAQMGACYRYGNGVTQNEKKAAEWFKKAANLGDNWGQFCYGACLCEGRGVEQNVSDGLVWVRKAIANGYNPKFAKEYLEKILEGNQ